MARKEEDWIDLGQEQVPFAALLQSSRNQTGSKGPDHVALFPDKDPDRQEESLLTLKATIPNDKLPWLQDVKDERVEFLLILDRSGSMSGRPWTQVQSAATKVKELVRDRVGLTFVTYSSNAEFTKADNIQGMRASGSTNFVATFGKISEHLKKLKDGGSSPLSKAGSFFGRPSTKAVTNSDKGNGKRPRKLFVFFMTDGEDTCNDERSILMAKEHLQNEMEAYGAEVIVHVLGFSQHHNDAFLESLSLMGTSDGSYNFIAEDDGETALKKRLIELVEATTGMVGKSAYVHLKFDPKAGHKFIGNWFGNGQEETALQTFIHAGPKSSTLETSKFVLVSKNIDHPDQLGLRISLMQDLRDGTPQVPCKLTKVTREIMDTTKPNKDEAVVNFRILRTSLNMITTRMFDMSKDKNDKESVEKAQKELKPWFEKVLKVTKDSQVRMDKLGRGDKEVEQLAKAVENGLTVCKDIFENESQDMDYKGKKMRSAQASYYVQTNQMHNIKQTKRVSTGGVRKGRTSLQMMHSELS